MQDIEQWAPVPGFDGYEASTHGRFRSWRTQGTSKAMRSEPRMLKLGKGKDGYPVITLRSEGRPFCMLAHRAILETFVGPRPDGAEARHFPDRTITNIRLDNLLWGTRAQNDADKEFHGTVPRGERSGAKLHPDRVARGSRCARSRLTEEQARSVFAMKASGMNTVQIGRALGVSDGNVGRILRGESWSHLGLATRPHGPIAPPRGRRARAPFVSGL